MHFLCHLLEQNLLGLFNLNKLKNKLMIKKCILGMFAIATLAIACEDDDNGSTPPTNEETNSAPVVGNPLSGLTLERGFTTETVNLNGVFSDADDDELTLTASSSNTEVADVAVDGTTLTVTEGTAQGATEITVTATDPSDGSVDDQFTITTIVIEAVSTDNVFVMPIRKIKPGISIADFEASRDAYVALLEAEPGTLTDREMQPFGDFVTFNFFTPDLDSTYVGFTSFQNPTVFGDIGAATSGDVANTFFSNFDFISFLVLKPLNGDEIVDLADFANFGTNQVWEVAVRDLSQYDNFEQNAYETSRDAYLELLRNQDPWVREVQWIDITNPNIVVGMTLYTDQSSYLALQQDETFTSDPAQSFISSYPINVYGGIHNVLK